MTRAIVPKTTGTTPYPAAGVAITMTAWDAGLGSRIALTGSEVILIQNTDSGGHTYTITPIADSGGRTSPSPDAVAIGAGEVVALGRLALDGYRQADGYLWIDADDATVKFGAYQMQR